MESNKFQNKYRIPSARLQGYDYGKNGAYFITICTQNRVHYFGEIENGKMILNELGKLAEQFWVEIPNQFPFLELGNFVVMPNHIHGVLIIDKTNDGDIVGDTVETRLIASLPPPQTPADIPNATEKWGGITGNRNPMFHENISRIIRWYKGRCSFEMRKIHADFGWQSRFHDHIIRDSKSFKNIQNYIENNPGNWKEDRFF